MTSARILITTASRLRQEGLRRLDVIGGLNYAEAVTEAGGLPLFVPNVNPELAEAYLAAADGLLLSGGADADPRHFGQQPHPQLGLVDESRDAFEFALYQAAKAKGMPVLGICRGLQMINVAEGGSLHQHLPALPTTMQHDQRNADGTLFHEVALEPDSRLATGLGRRHLRVNSYHHQAIDRLGQGLRAVGGAADGVIEAAEGTGEPFILGVQWHPEMSFARYPEQRLPFQLFLDAVRRYRESSRPAAVA